MAQLMTMFMFRYLTLYFVPDKTHGSISQVKINLTTMMSNCDDHQLLQRKQLRCYKVQNNVIQI